MTEKPKLAFYRKLWCLFAATAALSSHAVAAQLKVLPPGNAVTDGGVFFLSVVSPVKPDEVLGLFQEKFVDFYPDPVPGSPDYRYTALVGVEYGTEPGALPLIVKIKSKDKLLEEKVEVKIVAGNYPSEKLTVPPRTVTPSAKDRKLIARDRVVLAHAYASKTQERLWDFSPVMPVGLGTTSIFGTSRVYNGKKQNVHFGTDLRAPTGTPIVTPITGKVVLARKLFFTGYTVILDHGYGLFTIYGHMSKLKTKEGALIKKGKVMGLSGATGRASGPHLHWGVNLHGVKVDPFTLIKTLGLPTDAATQAALLPAGQQRQAKAVSQ